MPRISKDILASAIRMVTAMSHAQRESLCDEIYRRQPNLLMSVVAQKPLGASFEQIEVLLTMLMVSYEAMQGSGHAWPPIAEALQERCLERITQELRSTEGIAAVQRDRIIQVFLAGHSEPWLLAYVYGQLAEHGLSKVTDDGEKFVILAALNLVECIAEAARLRAGS